MHLHGMGRENRGAVVYRGVLEGVFSSCFLFAFDLAPEAPAALLGVQEPSSNPGADV